MGNESNKIDKLLEQLGDNRVKLSDMLISVGKLRDQIDVLLPEKVDYKNKYILPERLKAVSQIISNELSIRKQIDDSIKLEIDVRNRISGLEDGNADLRRERIEELALAIRKAKSDKENSEKIAS